MNIELKRDIKDSAKDFLYFGYGFKSFSDSEVFEGIDKEILKDIWKEAKKEMSRE